LLIKKIVSNKIEQVQAKTPNNAAKLLPFVGFCISIFVQLKIIKATANAIKM
jgi:hypothetical protein